VPAAAVIPAPIAYTKVVAVEKLVVGFQGMREKYDGFKRFNHNSYSLNYGILTSVL
jgi:hypothetical protein